MADDLVLYEVRDGVALVTLNRPERMNAWTTELQNRYFDVLDQAVEDPGAGAIVVTGAGRGFCPGADMDVLSGVSGKGAESITAAAARPVIYPLTNPKAIVGAINGACAGLGLVQALMMDVRFAAAGAKFTTAFVRRGLIAEHGISWMLPRLVGTSNAADLLLSGRVFPSEEALELGLVNRVYPGETLLDEALAYARDIAENCAPASVAVMKRQLLEHQNLTVEEALAESNTLMRQSIKRPDFKEGVTSYVEKRPPSFAPFDDAVLAR